MPVTSAALITGRLRKRRLSPHREPARLFARTTRMPIRIRTPANPALNASNIGRANHNRFVDTATMSIRIASQQGTMPPVMPRTISPHQVSLEAVRMAAAMMVVMAVTRQVNVIDLACKAAQQQPDAQANDEQAASQA